MIGQTLERFRIGEEIGRGGMGVVYKARDTRLDRDVALKVLPADRTADAERRRRFEQEARSASALQHPNIVAIYDITRAGNRDVIVMELVSGQTLARLIEQRKLGLSQALDLAIQIADGLSRAHAAGLVHRDLKPSNIMVTDEGVVKILDFGLAKLLEDETIDAAAPTVTAADLPDALTADGAIVGTAAYMSPEQAHGAKVDSRSDVFSFGSVLYEMVTGQRAFQRETTARTLTAIVSEEPHPVRAIRADIPQELERVIERCLRKAPPRRWQNMADLRVVLQDLKEDSESGKLQAIHRPPRARLHWGGWAAAVIALIGLSGGVAWWVLSRRTAPPAVTSVTRLTFDVGATMSAEISRDGKLLTYASDRADAGNSDIWVQQITGGHPLRLTDNPLPDWSPAFSPDGSRIAFRSERDGGGIYMIDALGGEAQRITDGGFFPKFSPDGSQISYVDIPPSLASGGSIRLVDGRGGAPRSFHPEFELINANISAHPVWSVDGRHLLFEGMRGEDAATIDWWIAPLDGSPVKRVGVTGALPLGGPLGFPRAWTANYIYYVSGSTVDGINLFRVPFDSARLSLSGEAEALTTGAGMKWVASLDDRGSLVFSHLTWTSNVWSAARADEGSSPAEPSQLTVDETVKFSPRVSHDGSRLVYSAFAGSRGSEVTIHDVASGRETTLPAVRGITNLMVSVSADGRLIAYRAPGGGRRFAIHSEGSSADRTLCEGCNVHGFSSDSTTALVQYGSGELVRQDLSSGARTPILRGDAPILDASLSWDDRWIALLLGEPAGNAGIYIAPVGRTPAPPESRILVRKDDRILASPRFSPDGQWLYYMSNADGFMCIWRQRLDAGSRQPVGEPTAVLHLHGRRNVSFPLSLPPLEILRDRLVFLLGESKGNLYLAHLDRW